MTLAVSPSPPGATAAASPPILRVESVAKSFPVSLAIRSLIRSGGRVERRTVLRDVDFEVRRGELFGLLGANGAGKTSLLKMLATLWIPDRGRILVDGIDAGRDPHAVRRRIGLCTAEERSFSYRLSGRANLRFFGALAGLRGRTLRARVETVVEQVDLGSAAGRPFHTYSSGMRQRLTVARALLADPELLLLDEPTRAVDPVHAEALRRLIRCQLVERAGKTVVLATNLLEEAWSLCGRIAIVDGGTIAAIGTPSALAATMKRRERYEIVLAAVDSATLEAVRRVPGVAELHAQSVDDGTRVTLELALEGDALGDVVAQFVHAGARIRSMRYHEPQPMEVFTHHLNGAEAHR